MVCRFGYRAEVGDEDKGKLVKILNFSLHGVPCEQKASMKAGGWLTDPKKALYNRIYNRTTFSTWDLLKKLFG